MTENNTIGVSIENSSLKILKQSFDKIMNDKKYLKKTVATIISNNNKNKNILIKWVVL